MKNEKNVSTTQVHNLFEKSTGQLSVLLMYLKCKIC